MAKQRQSAVPAVVMHLVKLRWQAKYRATPRRLLPANFRTKVRLLVRQSAEPHWQARSRATLRALLPAKYRTKAMLPVEQPLLEPQG